MARDSHPQLLHRLMAEAGVSQAVIVRATGENKQTVNKLHSGITQMSKAWAMKLEPVLGKPWPVIMGYDEVQKGAEGLKGARLKPSKSRLIPEYDVTAQMGPGGAISPLDGEGNHPIIGEWAIPPEYLASAVRGSTRLAVIQVIGDSMQPDFFSGERVLVDLDNRQPTPPGTFVLWDGLGLVVKRCEFLMNSDPPRVKISSINPGFETYETLLADVIINGRVVGKWTWK